MECKGNANKFLQSQSNVKDKTLSSQVLEYYKKYSQNRELPKYFCGASSSFKIEDFHSFPVRKSYNVQDDTATVAVHTQEIYKAPIIPEYGHGILSPQDHVTVAVNTEEIYEETIKPSISQSQPEHNNWTRSSLIGQDNLCDISQSKIPDINIIRENACATSPVSSIPSNRKLEWDNGADIGYSNVQTHRVLQKSLSLPVLSNLEYDELRKSLLRLSPEGNNPESPQVQLKQCSSEKSSDSDLVKDLQSYVDAKLFNPPYSSSTSESIKPSKKNYISSSSSSEYPRPKQFFTSSSESVSELPKASEEISKFLKGTVGLPIAESTPIICTEQNSEPAYSETPKLIRPKINENNKNLVSETVSKEKTNFVEKLSNSCDNFSSLKAKNLKRWHSQIDLNMVDQVSHYKIQKVLMLYVSKPIVVECIGVIATQVSENKLIQTSLPRNASIAIQTDFTDCQNVSAQPKRSSPKFFERQSVLYVCHSDSEKERNTHSSATQTNSDVLSKCNSFEYLYGADYDQNMQKTNKKTESVDLSKSPSLTGQEEIIPGSSNVGEDETAAIDRFVLGNLKKCPPKSDLTTVTPDTDKTTDSPPTTSKESPLANLISAEISGKQSRHLIPDLEKNIQLLQKVMKSKEYDNITKKYCLKKIIQKMIDFKYTDDSSESYDDKKKLEVKKSNKKSSNKNIYESVSDFSEVTSKSNENEENNSEKTYLHDNKPWLPVQQASHDNSHFIKLPRGRQTQPRKLETQTFVNEILPKSAELLKIPTPSPNQELKPTSTNLVPIQVVRDKNSRLQRNPLFTLTDHGLLLVENAPNDNRESSNSTANELYDVLQPSASEIVTPRVSSTNSPSSKQSHSQNISSESTNKGFQSWREDKTRSEKLLEAKATKGMGDFATQEGNKDHLARFAKKEREHQQFWINNEISHLSKLKKLLEREQKPNNSDGDIQHKVLRTVLEKPRVEDMKGLKKSTSVYIVTTEKSSGSGSSTAQKVCNSRTCKNPACQRCYVTLSEREGTSTSSGRNVGIQERVSSAKQRENFKPQMFPGTCKCKELPYACKCDQRNMPLRPPSLIGRGETIVDIGNEKIDMKNARLVSSEQFTTNNGGGRCRTSIRRYTFEILIDNTEKVVEDSDTFEIVTNQVDVSDRPTSPKQIIRIHDTNEHLVENHLVGGTLLKSSDRLTRELVMTDEIISERSDSARRRSASPKRCTCINSRNASPNRKSSPCRTSLPKSAGVCKCANTQTSDSLVDMMKMGKYSSSSSSSSGSSQSDVTSGNSTTQLCNCCKRKCTDMLRKSCLESDNKKYVLCHPCYNQNRTTAYFTYPGHVCACYNLTQQIKDTIQELESLEREEEYCKCVAAKARSGYCTLCKCKLRNKGKNKRGGMAYILTLESDEKKHKKHKKKTQPVLEEVKIKVVSPRSKRRQLSASSKSSGESSKENWSHRSKKHHRKKKSGKPSLQEYLCANKPNFIASAEQRRQCLLDLAYMREQRCQKYKQLLALTNGIPLKNCNGNNTKKKQHIFSPKEMKEMTAKKYKTLPEKQKRLVDNKEKQIKKANKLLADIFNQKLRQQVLKGKHTLPPDASIINSV